MTTIASFFAGSVVISHKDLIHAALASDHPYLRGMTLTASCPCCGTICQRVHSHSTRTLRDLPASGRPLHLKVRVRRFFCEESTCRRKIFAERFPSLTLPRAKFTLRLQEALREMGFELGGEADARLGKKLSYEGEPRHHFAPGQTSPTASCLIPTRSGAG